jgi:HSP20 family protein
MLRPYRTEEDEGILSRMPLVDMVDKGDRYHLRLEIPGIDKDEIQLNAIEDFLEISGEQSEKEHGQAERRNYIYNELSHNSFYRSIPTPEEIIPLKISAKMQNGILQVDIPKKEPSRPAGRGTRIQIE